MCGRVRLANDYSEIKIRLKFAPDAPAPNYEVDYNKRTHPTSAVLSDGWYLAKRVTLSLALRSSGDAGRGFGRVGAAAALVAG
jgi:hypothetical protein